MISFKTLNKKIIVFLSLLGSILLMPAMVYATDLDNSSSVALPYLAPNLDDAKLYILAEEIQENTRATSSTYDIDDIYNMLVSIRSYINTSNSNTSSILTELQDLTGNGTAYNTHSMLMDMWMRIGGNSSLGNTYTIIDLLKDVGDVLNNSLISTDGNETYNISELLAGIYGIYATPRSIPDLYDRLVLLDAKIQNIEDYTSYISGDAYTIADAVSRLADIYASNDVAAAKQAQQQYEDESIADFTGSGTGAATTGNKNDIKGISSTVKQGLNTGGSASNALGVFSYNGSEWDWFTITTSNNLNTIPSNDTFISGTFTPDSYGYVNVPLTNPIPINTRIDITITFNPISYNFNTVMFLLKEDDSLGQQYSINANSTTVNKTSTAQYNYYSLQLRCPPTSTVNITISVHNEETRKSNYIPDFITNHDTEYYNILLEDKK